MLTTRYTDDLDYMWIKDVTLFSYDLDHSWINLVLKMFPSLFVIMIFIVLVDLENINRLPFMFGY